MTKYVVGLIGLALALGGRPLMAGEGACCGDVGCNACNACSTCNAGCGGCERGRCHEGIKCCPHCGCNLVPVCHTYCEPKTTSVHKHGCVCGEICIPGVSRCGEGCGDHARCGSVRAVAQLPATAAAAAALRQRRAKQRRRRLRLPLPRSRDPQAGELPLHEVHFGEEVQRGMGLPALRQPVRLQRGRAGRERPAGSGSDDEAGGSAGPAAVAGEAGQVPWPRCLRCP